MFEILVILVVLASIYIRVQEDKHRQKYKAFYNLPTPTYIPVLGNTFFFFGKNILKAFGCVIKNVGLPCLVYLPHRTYITKNPEEIKILLNHPNALEKSAEYNTLQAVFKKSLLLAPVPHWKKNRKLISKGFNQPILDSFVPTFYEKSTLLNGIFKNNSYDIDNIYDLFQRYTLDTFCEATLGIKSTILNEKDNDFVNSIRVGQILLADRIGNIMKMNETIFSLMKDGRAAKKCQNYVVDFIQDIISKKRLLCEEEKDILKPSNRLPVLDLLLQISEKETLDDDYIIEEMSLFAGAATDTTAYSMCYACCLLGMHPEVQEKIYEEVISVVGTNRDIEQRDLHKLKYTEMAINETLRIIPVIPWVGRQTTDDIDLGTKVIPSGTGIIVYILGLHRDEKIYPNPTKYDPDRFLPEEVAKRPQYSFLPFSGGPRNCIGWKYALMVMKTTIANIVREFKISSKYKSLDELEFESSVVMHTIHPLDCHFTSR